MPATVYFDTNVFRHLREEEEGVIRRAIDTNRISILLSVINLEELLAALESAPESEVLCRMRRLLTLVDRGRFLKDASMLLTDDLRSYARCGFAERPFLSDDDYIRALQGLRALEAGDPSLNVQQINMEARTQRVQFLQGMLDRRSEAAPDIEQLRGITFETLWQEGSVPTAEKYAGCVGVLDDCRRRGIDGLLRNVRSVRMTVGIGLSYQYVTAHQEQPQQPRIGDSPDLQHPVLAAARADVFVTRDAKLYRITERVPMERFRVSTLKGFLEELDGQTAEGGSN